MRVCQHNQRSFLLGLSLVLLLGILGLAPAAAAGEFSIHQFVTGQVASGTPRLMYGITDTDLVIIDQDDPSNVTVVGPHGFSRIVWVRYNPLTDTLVGSAETNAARVRQIVTIDRITGQATPFGPTNRLLSPTFVDSRGEIVGTWADPPPNQRRLFTLDESGNATFLVGTSRDLDDSTYDSNHDIFYGINVVRRSSTVFDYVWWQVDLDTGATTNAKIYRNGGRLSGYDPARSAFYSINIFNQLTRIDASGGTLGAMTVVGEFGTDGPVRGVGFAPPPSAAAWLAALQDLVASLGLPGGLKNALLAKLDNALASLEAGNLTAAFNQIEAFKNQVEAQTGKKISQEDAALLLAGADNVLNAPV